MAMLTEMRGSSVREASGAVLPAGCKMSNFRIWGADTFLFHRVDAQEDARRSRTGAGGLDRIRHLETLMALPMGLPVPLLSLDRRMRTAIRSLPAGAVELDRTTVTRWAVRPMRIELAVVRAPGWRRGLELAGQFAPFCRRAMLLERPRGSLDGVFMEAGFYGIGVLTPSNGGFEMAVEPEEYRPERHTAAAWSFVEEMYQLIKAED